MLNKNKWKYILISILTLSIIAFGALRSARAFEYKEDAPDVTGIYTVTAGEELHQDINPGDNVLGGAVIRLRDITRSEDGFVTVTLLEDGSPVRSTSIEANFLDDCGYQPFRFSKQFKCDGESQYSLSIKYEADDVTEGGIEVYISAGGSLESSLAGGISSELVCQNLYINAQLQKTFILMLSLLTIAGIILLVRFAGLNVVSPWKIVLATVLILAALEALCTDLMPSILRNVVVASDDTESETELILSPGETVETTFDVDYASINRLMLFPAAYKYDGLNLYTSITDENTKSVVYEGIYTEEQMITNLEEDEPAISISLDGIGQKLPLSSYKLTIRNDGVNPIALSATETDEESKPAMSQVMYTWAGYWAAFGILFLLVILLIGTAICVHRSTSIEKCFLVAVIPLAIIYCMLFQPWNANDPNAHYSAIYRLVNILLGDDVHDAWYMRADDYAYFGSRMWLPYMPSMSDLAASFYDLSSAVHQFVVQDSTMIQQDVYANMEYYSLFCYLPEVLGFTIARILHFGSLPMVYMGRLFMMAAYIAAMYHAIHITPIGKHVYAIFALLPMPLMIASALSYDGMVLISTACFTASLLRLYKEMEGVLRRRYLIETACWAFLLGAVKGGGYLIFLPLVLILVTRDWKDSLKLISPIISAAVLSVVLFDVILPGDDLFQFDLKTGEHLTTAWGFSHPLDFFDMIVRTYMSDSDSLLLNMGGISKFYFGDAIPYILIVALMIIGGLGAIFERDQLRLGRKDKLAILFVCFLAIYFTPIMLLSSTGNGSLVVDGLQGRYFLPILPLIFILITKFTWKDYVKEEETKGVAISRCFFWFCLVSALAVYTMMRCYLTR